MLPKLKSLYIFSNLISDAGCAKLVAALDAGAMPALTTVHVACIVASDAAQKAVQEALKRAKDTRAASPA